MDTSRQHRIRTGIAKQVRSLREARRLTQTQLSKTLGLSQGRFSEIERGQGSFTAEQFLDLLKLFNVPASLFLAEKQDAHAGIQNALARLGASHLHESLNVLPSELLEQTAEVIKEVLVAADSPRHLASLAPVLVYNIDRLNLNKLWVQFIEYGLEQRLAWLVDNTLFAIHQELRADLSRKQIAPLRKADVVLSAFLDRVRSRHAETRSEEVPDILGTPVFSKKTLTEVTQSSSFLSRRWGIATNLQPEDFLEALRASRVTH